MTRRLIPGLLLALALLPRLALADPKDDARRHFVAGLEAAKRQDYQGALDEFLAAQEAYPHPATVYNIARSYGDLGDYAEAIRYYRIYQEMIPEKAEAVDPDIAALEARMRAPAPTPASPVASAPVAAAPTATSEAVARLQAISEELARLSASLSERATAPPAPTEPTPSPEPSGGPTTSPSAPPPAASGDLMGDAYERVVVTASRYGQSPLDSPSTVAVLTEQDIQMSGATDVPELLRRVAGIDVMSLASSQAEVSIRSFNRELSNKVLVLIDGRSVYSDLLGSVFWSHLPIGLQEIDRIEIIRGPGSAVYGANAVTGVINILTKRPGEGKGGLVLEAGSPGYLKGDALVTGRQDRTSYRMSAGYHQTGRWQQEVAVDDYSSLEPLTDDQDQAMSVMRADARVDRSFLDRGYLSVSGGYAEGPSEFYSLGALGDYGWDMENGYARADVAYGPVHLRGFYNSVDGRLGPWYQQVGERSLVTDINSDVIDAEIEGNHSLETGPVTHRMNAGVGYRYKLVEGEYFAGEDAPDGRRSETHLNAFAQEQASIGPVNLVGSFRVDKHPLVAVKQTLSPRAAAIVRVADHTSVRLSGGTSFRAPTFLESYTDLELPVSADGVFLRVQGSQDLVPERIVSGEVGVHDESTSFHTADVAVYVNRVTHLIGLSSSEAALVPFDPEEGGFLAGNTSFVNLDTVYTGWGIEADGRLFPVDGLDLYANVAIQQVLQDGVDETGATLPRTSTGTSTAKLNLGVMYRSPWRVDVATHISALTPQTWQLREYDAAGQIVFSYEEIPARAVLVGRLAVRPLKDNSVELACTAWNLLPLITGQGFQEHPKGQDVSSRLYGALTWRF